MMESVGGEDGEKDGPKRQQRMRERGEDRIMGGQQDGWSGVWEEEKGQRRMEKKGAGDSLERKEEKAGKGVTHGKVVG